MECCRHLYYIDHHKIKPMKKISILCALSMIMAIACKKNDTPGPQGQQGPQGNSGTVTLITHDTITDLSDSGRTGGVSVIYSDWFTPGSGWTSNSSGNTNGQNTNGPITNGSGGGTTSGNLSQFFYFNKAAPQISQAILDKGVVLAYVRFPNDPATRPLPANTVNSGVACLWNFTLNVNYIQFSMFAFSPIVSPGFDPQAKFRYVIIPPSGHLRMAKSIKDMSYEEVCSLYHIQP